MTASTLDFSHVIRDRLTSIALCANSLQSSLGPKLTSEHVHSFGIILSSVTDIKAILDQLANCYHAEMSASRYIQNRSELIGAPITSGASLNLPKATPKVSGS
jgi:hypothetical protein